MKKIALVLLLCWSVTSLIAQHVSTLKPVEDMWVKSNGGGEGKNPFMKFNLSVLPPGSIIQSVYLKVMQVTAFPSWDYDLRIMNFACQGWVETDSVKTFWDSIRPDTVTQLIGFGGSAQQWQTTDDIKDLINLDYLAGHQYSTITLKDPDDPTCCPGINYVPYNDTLIECGNIFNDFIIFYSSEISDTAKAPRILIAYVVPPYFITQPTNQTLCAGDPLVLSVVAGGDTVMNYQWYKNNVAMPGEDSSSYSVPASSAANNGSYYCVITNAYGDDTSNVVSVLVNALPTVYNVTGGGSYCVGGTCPSIGLSGSQIGCVYALILNGATPVDTVFGTGGALNFGPICTSGFYYIGSINLITQCWVAMSGTAVITMNPLPSVNAGPDQHICIGSSASLSVSGGTDFVWSPAGTLNDPNIFNPVANPSVNTTYTVTGTDANGCTATDAVIVFVDALPTVDAGPDISICSGSCTTLSASGGTLYTWTPPGTLDNPNIANPIACPMFTTTYTVSITSGACVVTDDVVVTVVLPCSVDAGLDQNICQGQSVTLYVNPCCTSYSWSDGSNNFPNGAITNPSVTTTYTVTAFNSLGCTSTDDLLVTVSTCTGIDDNPDNEANLRVSPNPLTDLTVFTFILPERDEVELVLFDVTGRKTETLLHETMDQGKYDIVYDAIRLNAGIYIYCLKTSKYNLTGRLIIRR